MSMDILFFSFTLVFLLLAAFRLLTISLLTDSVKKRRKMDDFWFFSGFAYFIGIVSIIALHVGLS
jgi:hypothetical protein